MKKLSGLLIGATMMASIPVMADEQVLRDSELDTITAGSSASIGAQLSGDASMSGGYHLVVSPTAASADQYAIVYAYGESNVLIFSIVSSRGY